MKKIIIMTTAISGLMWSFMSFAQRPGEFVRKKTNDTPFFIPEKEMNRAEKLPEFMAPEYDYNEPLKAEQLDVKYQDSVVAAPAKNEIPVRTKKDNTSKYLDNKNLDNVPAYTKKYDDYLNDLKVISETGIAPENKELQDDLSIMDSDEKVNIKDILSE